MRYTLNDILKMDQYLMNISAYEVSAGLMYHPHDVDSAMQFNRKVIKQFQQFKLMIQNNECTLEEVEQMVIRRHGAIADPYSKMSFNEALEAISMEDKNAFNDQSDSFTSFVDMFMNQIGNAVAELENSSGQELLNQTGSLILPKEDKEKKPARKRTPTKRKTKEKTDDNEN